MATSPGRVAEKAGDCAEAILNLAFSPVEQDLIPLLRLTSIQAPNQDFIIAGIAGYLGKRLGISTEFVKDPPWPEREQALIHGEIQIGWICGLPYVREAAREPAPFELLVAPVMKAQRYQMQPIYFSDVIVHRSSIYRSFADLRGATWAYNEPQSHSGYNLTRYHLASIGETGTYFRSVIAAGSHQAAIKLVLGGEVEASAIDSTVLELEFINRPDIRQKLRIVETLGPSPIPPLVVSPQISSEMRDQVRTILLEMHNDQNGHAILDAGQIDHFVQVTDQDYDPIRMMARVGSRISF